MKWTRPAAGLLLALACGAARAQDTVDARLAALEARPGVEVSVSTAGDGIETREIKLPIGVTVTVQRKGGEARINGFDGSQLGAVTCLWELYIVMAAVLDVCALEQDQGLREELAAGIGRINGFIADNSLWPATVAEVEAAAAARFARSRDEGLAVPSEMRQQVCAPGEAGNPLVAGLRSSERAGLKAEIDKLISVPRPPMMNPCM